MTIYAAEVIDGVVTRVVVLTEDKRGEGWVKIGRENTVGIGWTYENGEFIPPLIEKESESDA
ncbi:hypothetical protein Q0601_14960 [Paracoccus onubensis]|uniref:hypothetical protein n=1 Tax=Paracoccus onubensis TaxID=1675788 RepID=UPI0027311FAB|nr:hypothetical protein [Paracoccus onubensis]MDP0928484.1 hypothetical protein [Paracoccus onubensis]